MTLPTNPYRLVRGRNSLHTAGAASDVITRSASLPAANSYTICGWSVRDVDRNAYSCVMSLEDASDYNLLATETDGDSLGLWQSLAGSGVALATLVNRVPFFWAMTGGAALLGYFRYWNVARLVSASATSSAFTPTLLRIGNDSFSESFNGRHWNVRVWNTALTAIELLKESHSLIPVRQGNLTGWYPLEGNLQQAVVDYSGARATLAIGGVVRATSFFLPRIAIPRRVLGKTTGAGSFAGNMVEAATAVDATSALVVFGSSLAEAATATDTPSANFTVAAAITESITAADAPSASVVFSVTVSEAATADDAVSATLGGGPQTYEAAVTEAVSATDAIVTNVLYQASIAETASVTDVVSAVALFASSLTENGAALDAVASAAVFASLIVEELTALDAISSVVVFAASVTEAASATDSPSATGGSDVGGGTTYIIIINE